MEKRILIGLFSFMAFCSNAFAWGAKGHEIVADAGTQLTSDGQDFWVSNLSQMNQLTTVPDRKWKASATKNDEAPTHWFQIDAYVSDLNASAIYMFPATYNEAVQKYGESAVITNGTAPYRIAQFYNLALEALRSNDLATAIQYVGVMSHYIGDLSQPLHVSENFDGQNSGNNGIHKFFETDIIKDKASILADVTQRAQRLLQDPSFQAEFKGSLTDIALHETARSVQWRDQILSIDNQYGRGAQGQAMQLELAKDRMADGAATLSMIMSQLWRDAGLNLNATPIPVSDPSWVAPEYLQSHDFEMDITPLHPMLDDDCFDQAS